MMPPVNFDVTANNVQNSAENLVNDGEQPGPSVHISVKKTATHIKYRGLVN